MSIPVEEELMLSLDKLVKMLHSLLGTLPLDKKSREMQLEKVIEEFQLSVFLLMDLTLPLLISTMIITSQFGKLQMEK
jgi:hypothetical protein